MMMNAYDHGYDHGLPFNFDIDIEEVCNGVVDPTTQKTLTKTTRSSRYLNYEKHG